jgi:hypothetical protein
MAFQPVYPSCWTGVARRASSRGLHPLIALSSEWLLCGDDAPFNGGTGEPFSPAETFVMHNCFVSEGTT